jgi:asparagine synthetase B (glutamine-hydrolysing)
MCDSIVHRGPDDEGYVIQGPVGLGVRRLSIIDVEGGSQPICNEDATVHVVYNGEIYNYRELKSELERRGHIFGTRSDTEVIVHAYEEDEERCLDRFRGMFSFALWDAPRRSLLLVVDRFGIKPLYYAATATGIVCGSELKCLLRSGLFDRNLDLDALAQYFTLNYVPPPATIFTGAQRLPPASLLRWTANGGTTVRQYWELPRDRVQQARPPAEARRQLRGVAQLLPASLRSAAGAVPRLLERASRSRFNDRVAALGRRTADTLLPPEIAFRRKITAAGLASVRPLLSYDLGRSLEDRDPFVIVDRWLSHYGSANEAHPLERFVHTGLQVSLAGDMLVKVDRASMANSLEVRVPLLDHLLAEYVATIPIGRRMPRWRLKGLLKDTMAESLPPEILNQRKQGFNVPLSAWIRGSLSEFALDILTSSEVRKRGLIDSKAVERFLRGTRDSTVMPGSVIWSILVFELWCRHALT